MKSSHEIGQVLVGKVLKKHKWDLELTLTEQTKWNENM